MSPRGSRDSSVTGQTRLRNKDVAAFGQLFAKLGSRRCTHMKKQRQWQRTGSVIINQCLTYVTINTVGSKLSRSKLGAPSS